jgi:hypothetical protein
LVLNFKETSGLIKEICELGKDKILQGKNANFEKIHSEMPYTKNTFLSDPSRYRNSPKSYSVLAENCRLLKVTKSN